VVIGMALSADKRSFPSEVARWSDVVCTPPEVGPSEAVEAAACDWGASAEPGCNFEAALALKNYGVKRWRLSSPGNWSWRFSLSACSQSRTASRRAHPSSCLQF